MHSISPWSSPRTSDLWHCRATDHVVPTALLPHTITRLAKEVGVSRGALSRALNGRSEPHGRHQEMIRDLLALAEDPSADLSAAQAQCTKIAETFMRMTPEEQAAAFAFVLGLSASGSVDSALVAAKAAIAMHATRATGRHSPDAEESE